jgi:hypothetical protein
MTKICWKDIVSHNEELIDSSGIYAWYYRPKLSKCDVKKAMNDIENSNIDKENIVRIFLQSHLFDFYKEESYSVKLEGQLKPRYSGTLHQDNQVSESLIKKITKESIKLSDIKDMLDTIDESFLSPVYIGMSKNLKERLLKHKKIIHTRLDEQQTNDESEDKNDAYFADRVVDRNYIRENMFVIIKSVESPNVMENILNRISHPILGRN